MESLSPAVSNLTPRLLKKIHYSHRLLPHGRNEDLIPWRQKTIKSSQLKNSLLIVIDLEYNLNTVLIEIFGSAFVMNIIEKSSINLLITKLTLSILLIILSQRGENIAIRSVSYNILAISPISTKATFNW